MAVLRNLVVKIGADTAGLQKGLGDAQTKLGSSVTAMQKQGGKLAGVFTQAGTAIAGMSSTGASSLAMLGASAGPVGIGIAAAIGLATASFAALQSAAKETMPLYQEAAEGASKLTTVMRQRMGATDDMVSKMIDLANVEQQTGVTEGDAVVAGQQQLATFLHSSDALARLTPALADLMAQQKGVNATSQDAVTIGNMFGKVMTGQTSALKRVGISFTEAQEAALKEGNEVERAALLAQIITDNVGNMNQAMSNTNFGPIAQLNNAWGDLKEQVGEAFTNLVAGAAPALTYIINTLAKAMQWVTAFTAMIGFGWRKLFERATGSAEKMTGAQDKNADSAKGVAAQQKKVGKAIGGARKEAQKWLASFDQLNKVQKAAAAGGGGGAGTGIDDLEVDQPVEPGLSLGDMDDPVKVLIEKIRAKLAEAWERLKEKFPVLADIEATAKLVGAGIATTLTEIKTALQTSWDALMAGGTQIADEFKTLWGVTSSAIGTAWTNIWNQVKIAWDGVRSGDMTIGEAAKSVWSVASSSISTAWSTITSQVKTSWANIKKTAIETTGKVGSAFSVASAKIANTWTGIAGLVGRAWNGLRDSNAKPEGKGTMNAGFSVAAKISQTWDTIKSNVLKSWNNLKKTAIDVKTSVGLKWDLFVAGFTGAWSDVVKEAKKAINKVIGEFNKLIGKINAISISIPWWLGGGSLHLSLPSIPTIPLATGGYVQGPTFAQLGEQGYAEAVVPLERNLGWAEKMADILEARMQTAAGPAGDTYVYLDGHQIAARIERRQAVAGVRSNGRR